MKIFFLCGSLETGRDGVGDYTLRLAAELMRQGNTVTALSLHDKYIEESFIGKQKAGPVFVNICRIPSQWPRKKRYAYIKKYIDEFDPEWISLQYVPFAFQQKGLPLGIGKQLKNVGGKRNWHLMFHELWVGMEMNASVKYKLWGAAQRFLIRSFIRTISPQSIHTQSRIYQAQLAKLGFQADYLPLFGNIPLIDEDNNYNKKLSLLKSDNRIKLVIFGAIHPGAPIEKFANEVAEYSKEFNKAVSLTIIGRSGCEQDRWVKVWKAAGLPIEVLGEQSEKCISKILNTASLGVSTTPVALADKSGSVAAMQEHGLAVICVSLPWRERQMMHFEPAEGILEYRNGNFKELLGYNYKFTSTSKVTRIASEVSNIFSLSRPVSELL